MSEINSKIPQGPLAEKWTNYKNHQKLVNPANKRRLDVIVVGTGLAGASAAASLAEMGFNVLNFCIQDSPRRAHSIAAQGGINAAKNYQNDGDSVYRLFYDTIKGGDYRAREANVYRLAEVSNNIIDQCVAQGVPFAREYGGTLANRSFGGAQVSRTFYAKGQTGQQLLLGAYSALSRQVGAGTVKLYTRYEMLDVVLVDGRARGIIAKNLVTGKLERFAAHAVVIATGGAGRMHYQGFPTSNHYGATADGLVLGYRAGASLLYQDSIQYHPTGAIYPSQIMGALVTEKVRSVGAQLVNANGEAYIHPLETRDVNASGVIRECEEGRGVEVPGGRKGVWLDTPMIEILGGEGTIEKRIPAMFRMYMNYGIDMRKVPIVIYPTLHYQNGGLEINGDGFTKEIPNLLVAGEAAGGIHGRNRLMGNSLLDVIVFGRNAGKKAAAKCKNVELGEMNLDHIYKYAEELDKAGVHTDKVSPLLLPKYARHEQR